jgi:membrane-associated phospholipid phosphatase
MVVMLFNTGAEYPYLVEYHRLMFIGVVFAVSFLFPLTLLPIYFGLGIVRSIFMTSHKERTLPLIISSGIYFTGYMFLRKVFPDPLLMATVFAGSTLVLSVGIISFFWKISAHLTGLGGIFALALYLGYKLQVNTSHWFIFFALATGLTAFARLYEGAHNPKQVLVGFTLGATVVIICCGLMV